MPELYPLPSEDSSQGAFGIRARFCMAYPEFKLDVDLTLPGHGVTVLFGHSGSGKTTCLRCIAGLEQAEQGYLSVNGVVWQDSTRPFFAPPYKRSLGDVFQESSLFPHLNVRGNLEYGLRRVDPSRHRVSWEHIIDLLGIGHLLERMPSRLSGGERQRVGIARALLTSPSLLLMDEPMAALDLKRKNEILPYLERLNDELDIPMIYISHCPDEVARLADYVVLLDQGQVIAQGSLQDTMARLDLPIALGEDAGVVLEAQIAEHDVAYHLSRLDFSGGSVWVAQRSEPVGYRVRFRVYARDVSLATSYVAGSSIVNSLAAIVEEVAPSNTPAHVLVRVRAGQTALIARLTRRSCDQLAIVAGKSVWAQIKTVALLGEQVCS